MITGCQEQVRSVANTDPDRDDDGEPGSSPVIACTWPALSSEHGSGTASVPGEDAAVWDVD
jgi:hypothetical protein